MIIKLVPIGKYQGIRLPKNILKKCGISNEVEMKVIGKEIILKPYRKRKPREGWNEIFATINTDLTAEDKKWLNLSNEEFNEEWEWE